MKIRTDFVTNSSSSSFCITLGIKTKDTSDWNYFNVGVYYETLCSPKQLAECDTITDLFRKFHDESFIDGETLETMYFSYWEHDDEDVFDYEEYNKFEEEVLAWENFFKFFDDGEVEGFLDKHGEKRVSEYITDIGIFCHEEALYDEDDYQDTEYIYNLETSEYIGKISGEREVLSDGHYSRGIVVPDGEDVTVFITEYNGEERYVWKSSNQKGETSAVPDSSLEKAPAVPDNSCTEISSEFLDVIPHGSLEDDFDDSSASF